MRLSLFNHSFLFIDEEGSQPIKSKYLNFIRLRSFQSIDFLSLLLMKTIRSTDRRSLSLNIMFGLAGLLSLTTGAQTSGAGDDVITLSTLQVTSAKVATDSAAGTRVNTAIVETPQSLSVITRAELDARGVQRITDAVAYTAGVQSEFQGVDSRTDTFKIRGYDAGGFTNNIYLDGLRAPGGGQWTRAQFDPFGLERVEVLKGPSAVLYGAVSPGGVVNSVSKRPAIGLPHTVGVQVGSHNTLQGTFDVGGANADNSLLYRVVGLARDGEAEVDHTDLRRLFAAPSLTWNISRRTRLTLLAHYQKDEGGSTYQFLPQTGTLKPGANGFWLSPSTFLGEPDWNLFERTQYGLGYQFEHIVNSVFTLRQNLRYAYIDTEYRGIAGTPADANLTTGAYNRRSVWGYGDSDNVTVDTHAQAKFSTGDISHTVLGGVDFIRSDWAHTRVVGTAAAINIYNPVYTGVNAAAIMATAPQSKLAVTEQQTGFYVQEQAVLGKLHGTLGVRHDLYDIEYADAAASATVARVNQTPEATTWRAGLLYTLDNGLAPFVSYATSFSAESYTLHDVNGVPLDSPTESEQFEVGVKYKPAGVNALFTVSGFQLVEQNRLFRVIPTPARYNQVSEATTQGVELEGRAELLQGLDLIAAFTYLDSEISKTTTGGPAKGNRLSAVPEHIASLWLAYSFRDSTLSGLTLGAGVRHNGGTFGDDTNTIKIPGYTLFDASLTYDLSRSFPALAGASLRLSGTNLADKRYVASSTAPGAAWYGSRRNVSLSVRYSW